MPKVLLVEDNRLVKIVHERMLTRAGYQVATATDGEEALRLVRQFSPDVILLDLLLPKISGPEVLRALKQDPATAQISVIVLTGLSQKNEQKLRTEGASAFMEKSRLLDGAEPLLDMIEFVLRQNASGKNAHTGPVMVLSWTPDEIQSARHAPVRS
jgi:CheY-like chemotaxis protein